MDREDIEKELERATDYLAEASAAQAWSTPGDMDVIRWGGDLGEDIWMVATFGDHTAVNGDLIGEDESARPPTGFIDTGVGGRIPTTEEEVWVDHIIDLVVLDNKGRVAREEVERVADEVFEKGDVTYTSVGGDAETWSRLTGEEADAADKEFWGRK